VKKNESSPKNNVFSRLLTSTNWLLGSMRRTSIQVTHSILLEKGNRVLEFFSADDFLWGRPRGKRIRRGLSVFHYSGQVPKRTGKTTTQNNNCAASTNKPVIFGRNIFKVNRNSYLFLGAGRVSLGLREVQVFCRHFDQVLFPNRLPSARSFGVYEITLPSLLKKMKDLITFYQLK
jgi:hypothetical protein